MYTDISQQQPIGTRPLKGVGAQGQVQKLLPRKNEQDPKLNNPPLRPVLKLLGAWVHATTTQFQGDRFLLTELSENDK